MTIKSGKLCSSVKKRIRDVNELKHCRLTCNMGCSRQSLMKLLPANGVNVCELVFVPEMDVFSICFNFLTIFSDRWTAVGISYKHSCLLRMLGSFVA